MKRYIVKGEYNQFHAEHEYLGNIDLIETTDVGGMSKPNTFLLFHHYSYHEKYPQSG